VAENRLFEGLSAQERIRAMSSCIRKRYRRGEPVFSIRESSEFIYILEEGHVRLVLPQGRGLERILSIFRPGDVFGEILFSVSRCPFQAVAVDDAQVAIMSKATFLQFLSGSAQWGMNFIRLISDRLLSVQRDLAALANTWTRPRLVHLLLKLAETVGRETPQGTVITMPVTHEALANMSGASRVRVTSYVNQMRREGLLLKQGRLLVVRTEELKASGVQRGDRGSRVSPPRRSTLP
jgi:CRP/FNR family transcriptional regulator